MHSEMTFQLLRVNTASDIWRLMASALSAVLSTHHLDG